MPPADFTLSIQAPLLGSERATAASTQNKTPIPIAYVNRSAPPPTALPVVDTKPRRPIKNGPVHGAAMSPPTRPIPNAPPKPLPPTWLSLAWSPDGSASSNAPNIDRASARKRAISGNTTHGLCSCEPKLVAFPTSAMVTPSVAYVRPMPPTYAVASAIARRFETSLPRAPKIASVIGIIGYTHGVSEVKKPNPNDARYIQAQPFCWYFSKSPPSANASAGTRRTIAAAARAGQDLRIGCPL